MSEFYTRIFFWGGDNCLLPTVFYACDYEWREGNTHRGGQVLLGWARCMLFTFRVLLFLLASFHFTDDDEDDENDDFDYDADQRPHGSQTICE